MAGNSVYNDVELRFYNGKDDAIFSLCRCSISVSQMTTEVFHLPNSELVCHC